MPLHITPDIVEKTYELLRSTPPFKRWKLPHADDVEFHVTAHKDRHADYLRFSDGKFRIRVSSYVIRNLRVLTEALAHEMVHMRDRSKSHHGREFRRLADTVCKKHDFDRGTF